MIWKLLRQHISISQMAGFSLASLCGMVIILLSVQFYNDVYPILTQGDSFIKKDFIVVSKKVSTIGSLLGSSKNSFSEREIKAIEEQDFTKSVGKFTAANFKVSANIGFNGTNMSTAMFFESVPNSFVDIDHKNWNFDTASNEIPIVVPRNYLNLYNFGFAQSRGLPQLSEGMIGMISINIHLRGNRISKKMKGRIVGFSNRINTILVPEEFIAWANHEMGSHEKKQPSRLIVEVYNPADEKIAQYFKQHGYDTEDDKLNAGKTTWFLKVTTAIVLAVGLLISLLSFYILMLSIFLLLQKNTTKIENLLLMGFSPQRVALPYQLLTIGLNLTIFAVGIGVVSTIRGMYLEVLEKMMGSLPQQNIAPAAIAGLILLSAVSIINIIAIRKKIRSCFYL